MVRIKYLVIIIFTILFISTLACRAQTREDSIGVFKTLQLYVGFVARMNADSIGALFGEDGVLMKSSNVSIIGSKAVSEYLISFSGFHVISHRMNGDTLIFVNGYAVQTGEYWQQVGIPSGDTVNVAGRFRIEWQRSKNESWKIHHISTKPK